MAFGTKAINHYVSGPSGVVGVVSLQERGDVKDVKKSVGSFGLSLFLSIGGAFFCRRLYKKSPTSWIPH